MSVLVANLMQVEGLKPDTEPLPVVKTIILAPDAIWPVTEQGSYLGLSMKLRPGVEANSHKE